MSKLGMLTKHMRHQQVSSQDMFVVIVPETSHIVFRSHLWLLTPSHKEDAFAEPNHDHGGRGTVLCQTRRPVSSGVKVLHTVICPDRSDVGDV